MDDDQIQEKKELEYKIYKLVQHAIQSRDENYARGVAYGEMIDLLQSFFF